MTINDPLFITLCLFAAIAFALCALGYAYRRQRERLARVGDRPQSVFRDSPVPTAIIRLHDGIIVDANQAFTEMIGCTREDVLGKTSKQIGLWQNADSRASCLRELIEKGTVHQHELQYQEASGETAHALFSAQLVELEGEKRVLLMIQDITERRRAEVALRASEAFLSALINNTDDLILATDRQLHVTMMNDAFRKAIRAGTPHSSSW